MFDNISKTKITHNQSLLLTKALKRQSFQTNTDFKHLSSNSTIMM